MKLNLKVKNENGTENIQHEVEEIDLFQFSEAIKIISDVIKLAERDERLRELFIEIFDEVEEGEDVTEENGFRIVQKAYGAFEVILLNIPQKAFELLSVMSGIEYNVLMQQKLEDVFEIYDAVIGVNDMERLVNRAKKSLSLTKSIVSIFRNKKNKQQ